MVDNEIMLSGLLNKLKMILPVVLIGQIITIFLAQKLSEGAELGVLIIFPGVLLIGTLVQLLIIFIKIKDTIVSKIMYTVLALLFALAVVQGYSRIYRLIYISTHQTEIKDRQIYDYCMGQWAKYDQESGVARLSPHDPKYKQLYDQGKMEFKKCMEARGHSPVKYVPGF